MKTSFPTSFRNIALLSMLSATAAADPAILLDHNPNVGPHAAALVRCVQAAHSSRDLGTGLMLSSRVTVADSAENGTRTFILSGTTWDNGVRVPVKASCVMGGSSNSVATVTRIDSKVAAAQ